VGLELETVVAGVVAVAIMFGDVIELGTSLLYPLNVLWALSLAAFNTDDALVTGDRPNRHDVNFAGRFRGNLHHLD
jgi:hypothetical protein